MSTTTALARKAEERRYGVRAAGLNGIDYVEISGYDQRTLVLYFIGVAPEVGEQPGQLGRANVVISGGKLIPGASLRIADVARCKPEDLDIERDACICVTLDKPGDFSTYQLCLVTVDEEGKPIRDDNGHVVPFSGFDPRYACVDFGFKANCPTDLDCAINPTCPTDVPPEPDIDYLAKDYASFRQLILDRLALIMPDWHERHVPDLGITLVEVLAYVGDHLSYLQDAVATEAYLGTARQRISVRRHARLVDYVMHDGCNARAWVVVQTVGNQALRRGQLAFVSGMNDALGLATGKSKVVTWEALQHVPPGTYEVFEPVGPRDGMIDLWEDHNELHFYTWGDTRCCLPRGTTRATLRYPWTTEAPTVHLRPGDVLVLEEVVGPETGKPEDADPRHRQAVRLTMVTLGFDHLYNEAVVEIEWHDDDALSFPLCLSAIGPAPACRLLQYISVARGNVVLVDHGRTFPEDLPVVPVAAQIARCTGEGLRAEITGTAARFAPALKRLPVTQAAPVTVEGPAAIGMSAFATLDQIPYTALPAVTLASPPVRADGTGPLFSHDDLTDRESLTDLANQLIDHRTDDYRLLRQFLSHTTLRYLNTFAKVDPRPDELPEPLAVGLCYDLGALVERWSPVRDLLASDGDDRHFVVETDNDERAHLRFGDTEFGRRPAAGTSFRATYRVGNGPGGNVGAEAINHIVVDESSIVNDAIKSLKARNPLSARGGTAPQGLDEVRLLAPHTFRRRRERAITAADYAELAGRHPKVHQAAATMRWNGSWYEVQVAVDPLDRRDPDPDLLADIERGLYRYRRIGHDLAVGPAHYVSLRLKLTVCVQPGFLRGHVKAALLDILSNRRLGDGRLGFFHPDSLTFGTSVYASAIVATCQAITGVESLTVERLTRWPERANRQSEPSDPLNTGILMLGPLEIPRLDNDPRLPMNGDLELEMRGGR